jgi:branched-chain amino acid transport system substrate-binding protein
MKPSQIHIVLMLSLSALPALALSASAQADERPLRIGVLNDLSGPYADFQGAGSVLAAQMAVEDYGGKAAGRKVEIISADHQNKPDIGAALARQWFDQDGVDVVADVPNSSVALAVNEITRDKNKVFLASGAGTSELTGAKCSPNTVHWTYDTYSLGHALAKAVLRQGGKSWYFITADYAFGHDLEKQASDEVIRSGGTVLGAARHPIGASDFSSFLLQAQSSSAQVIALANAGADESNTLKQAAEFGVGRKQTIVGLIFGLQNVPAVGQKLVEGLQTVNAWYWNLNEDTRRFAQRYQERYSKHQMPNDMQAGMYSVVLHYLKAVDKAGGAEDGKAVVAAMKALPTDDTVYGKGAIRADGRGMHPMYLLQVKAPEATKEPWDYFSVVSTIPADQAFRSLDDGHCPLVSVK